MKILLVEDDAYIAEFICKGLREESYTVDHVTDGETGLTYGSMGGYDLIILDIMIPKMNGIVVCEELRKKGVDTPVIILTAKDSVKDKVSGLKSGADDYITKPFSFEEFLARIYAILRRRKGAVMEYVYGKLKMDIIAHSVYYDEEEIILRPKEYAVLRYLLINRRRTVSRTQILESVWGYAHYPSTNIVDVYIKSLREKLNPLFGRDIIRTVRGTGYMLEEN